MLRQSRGLARREPIETDRRYYALVLTEEGRALIRKLHKIAAEHDRRITERIGAGERNRLLAALRSITALENRPWKSNSEPPQTPHP